jgi:hypothetical protein
MSPQPEIKALQTKLDEVWLVLRLIVAKHATARPFFHISYHACQPLDRLNRFSMNLTDNLSRWLRLVHKSHPRAAVCLVSKIGTSVGPPAPKHGVAAGYAYAQLFTILLASSGE